MNPPTSGSEQPLVFECEGEPLIGILSAAAPGAERGVLIVVGGPQYRVGSHRQFALLARHLAASGIPTLRFDYRGMGDSGGAVRTFEDVSADIRCAVDRFFASVPGLKDIVIWGLCDAASAALFYAHRDVRIGGLVLLNPWVRTGQAAARAQLKHYYLRRLFNASLWQKIARGEFDARGAAASLGRFLADALGRRSASAREESERAGDEPLPDRMAEGLRKFRGRVLLILSEDDLTAHEFRDVAAGSGLWRKLLEDARVKRCELADANHTFARRDWRDQVARWTEEWVKSA